MGLVNAYPHLVTDLGNQRTLTPPLATSVHRLPLTRGRFPPCVVAMRSAIALKNFHVSVVFHPTCLLPRKIPLYPITPNSATIYILLLACMYAAF